MSDPYLRHPRPEHSTFTYRPPYHPQPFRSRPFCSRPFRSRPFRIPFRSDYRTRENSYDNYAERETVSHHGRGYMPPKLRRQTFLYGTREFKSPELYNAERYQREVEEIAIPVTPLNEVVQRENDRFPLTGNNRQNQEEEFQGNRRLNFPKIEPFSLQERRSILGEVEESSHASQNNQNHLQQEKTVNNHNVGYFRNGCTMNQNTENHLPSHSRSIPFRAEQERLASHSRNIPFRAEQERFASQSRTIPFRTEQERFASHSRSIPFRAEQQRFGSHSRSIPFRAEQENFASHSRSIPFRAEQENFASHSRSIPFRAEQERFAASQSRNNFFRTEQERLSTPSRNKHFTAEQGRSYQNRIVPIKPVISSQDSHSTVASIVNLNEVPQSTSDTESHSHQNIKLNPNVKEFKPTASKDLDNFSETQDIEEKVEKVYFQNGCNRMAQNGQSPSSSQNISYTAEQERSFPNHIIPAKPVIHSQDSQSGDIDLINMNHTFQSACDTEIYSHQDSELYPDLKILKQSKTTSKDVKFFSDILGNEENTKRIITYKRCLKHPFKFQYGRVQNLCEEEEQGRPINVVDTEADESEVLFSKINYITEYKSCYWDTYGIVIPKKHFYCLKNKLSEQMWEFFVANLISLKKYYSAIEILKKLFYYSLKKTESSLQQMRFYLAGSIISGLAHEKSNIDINVAYSLVKAWPDCLKDKTLQQFFEIIRSHRRVSYFSIDEKQAKQTSQVKANFTWRNDDFIFYNINLTVNSCLRMSNTQLNHLYSQLDWRFQPLYFVIRSWAANKDLIGKENSVLSSYAISLMVANLLQRCVFPPLLPVLEELPRHEFNLEPLHVREVKLEINYEWISENKIQLNELLNQFFSYFIKFDFSKYFVSTRSSEPPIRNYFTETEYMFIEEPFSKENVVKIPNTRSDYEKLLEQMKITYYVMRKKNWSLDEILSRD